MRGQIVSENAYALILSITKNLECEEAFKELGLKAPCAHSTILGDDQKDIIKDYYYKYGMSLTDIAKLYDVTRYTISSFLKRMDIPVKPRGRYFK